MRHPRRCSGQGSNPAAASVEPSTLASASLNFPKVDPRIVAWLVRDPVIEAEGSFFSCPCSVTSSPALPGVAAALLRPAADHVDRRTSARRSHRTWRCGLGDDHQVRPDSAGTLPPWAPEASHVLVLVILGNWDSDWAGCAEPRRRDRPASVRSRSPRRSPGRRHVEAPL